MRIIKAPEQITSEYHFNNKKIFLSGSINKTGKPWQDELIETLEMIDVFKDAVIYNPRREDWDSTWKETLGDKNFTEQVNWEISAMETSDIIFMVFNEDTQSPITILELGMFCRVNKLFVCCPEKFWKSGNVYMVCERYGIPYVKSFEDFKNKLKQVK